MGQRRPDELNPMVAAVRTAMATMTVGSGNESARVGRSFDWPSACLGNSVVLLLQRQRIIHHSKSMCHKNFKNIYHENKYFSY